MEIGERFPERVTRSGAPPAATGYVLVGPSSGTAGAASTNFAVALTPYGATVVGTATITPSDGGAGGTFTPATVALTTASPGATFTYTAASAGTKTISATNDKGLPNPASLSYVAAAASGGGGLADGAPVSTWPDSSGNGHTATQTGTSRPTFKTAIVNGKPVVRFDGVDDSLWLPADFNLTGEFTIHIVFKTTGDNIMLGAQLVNSQDVRVGQSGNNLYFDNTAIGGASATGTLSTPRASWNICTVARISNNIQIIEAGTVRGGASNGVNAVVGVIGTLGIAPTAAPTNGDIAEILVYNAYPSGGDFANILAYLGTKYGITVAGGGSVIDPSTVTGLVAWWKADSLL